MVQSETCSYRLNCDCRTSGHMIHFVYLRSTASVRHRDGLSNNDNFGSASRRVGDR